MRRGFSMGSTWLGLGLMVAGLALAAVPARAALVRNGQVAVELVPAVAAVVPGSEFEVALRVVHDPHWHTYWIQPGTGLPTTLDWELPPGFVAGPIQWPTPKVVRDRKGNITGNGYEGEAFLFTTIRAPADLAPGSTVRLRALAAWLMCEDVCIPGEANVELTLPVAAAPPSPHAQWGEKLAQARRLLPTDHAGWSVTARAESAGVRLRVRGPAGADATGLHFFAADGMVAYDRTQVYERGPDGAWEALLAWDTSFTGPRARLSGDLAAGSGFGPGGLRVDVPLEEPAGAVGAGTAVEPAGLGWGLLGFALLGGLILNLMPCVFPVLGIKVLGFVQQAGEKRSHVIGHGLVYTAGVVVSFWAVAALLLALRAGGESLGWGFQLQNPAFVFAVTVLLLLMALNLFGVFEVGASVVGVGANLQARSGLGGSFFTGVLATVVATPCSAPFLGTALGAALALPPASSFVLFTIIGLGLALPYLVFAVFPGLVRLLPRPGAWMDTFKQVMAFPLLATVVYLVWVLAGQMEEKSFLVALLALVGAALGAWVYGRFAGFAASPSRRWVASAGAALALGGSLFAGWPRPVAPDWEPWSPAAVQAHVAAGRTVYVDFTARWCATCQTNKATVFGSDRVVEEFRRRGVVKLKADWTNRDPVITAELQRFGRVAIPFNLIYRPDRAEPVALPELLTPDIVLENLGPG